MNTLLKTTVLATTLFGMLFAAGSAQATSSYYLRYLMTKYHTHSVSVALFRLHQDQLKALNPQPLPPCGQCAVQLNPQPLPPHEVFSTYITH